MNTLTAPLNAKATSAAVWLNKVPEVTLSFWVIKIMCTTVGETGADYLAVNAGLGQTLTRVGMTALLIAALFVQLRKRRYTPWIYWLTVVLVSIVGTQITDLFTDGMGVSLYLSTSVFAVLLAIIFAVWYAVERTLSVHEIFTRRRELFYWSAILCTFALGTAAGDLATEALGLGFTWGLVIFSGLIAATYAAWRMGGNAVLTFWLAYILTRPLGASLGDLLTQAKAYGGLGLGAMWTSALFLTIIVLLVAKAQYASNGSAKTPAAH
ncbi:putative membrane-anchored protein [Polaromonas sp. CG_9.5]|uniref:COG4705 family protein n=1 Tax=Polaromonas sp. CG_9.5 TaxID=3071705 RepID=UPI002E0AB1A7|nr:putative membrane-anchored protein [Polaromonas sp. CG_9.5]